MKAKAVEVGHVMTRDVVSVTPETPIKDVATALRYDLLSLEARIKNWRFEPVDGKRWGDNVEKNYQAYLDWLQAQGVIKTRTDVKDVITNELLDEVNKFNADAIRSEAKAYKAK